jgi:hypothetical protein
MHVVLAVRVALASASAMRLWRVLRRGRLARLERRSWNAIEFDGNQQEAHGTERTPVNGSGSLERWLWREARMTWQDPKSAMDVLAHLTPVLLIDGEGQIAGAALGVTTLAPEELLERLYDRAEAYLATRAAHFGARQRSHETKRGSGA